MYCPYCDKKDTYVIDTRWSKAKSLHRRRYQCRTCDQRFSTHETYTPITKIELLKYLGHTLTKQQERSIKRYG